MLLLWKRLEYKLFFYFFITRITYKQNGTAITLIDLLTYYKFYRLDGDNSEEQLYTIEIKQESLRHSKFQWLIQCNYKNDK